MKIKKVELEKPKYDWKYPDGSPSGGNKKKNDFNAKKYDDEKARYGINRELELSEKTLKRLKEEEDATGRIIISSGQSAELDSEYTALVEKFDALLHTRPSQETSIQMQDLLVEINDFLFNKLKPLEILVSKEVVVSLTADLSFKIGKFLINQNAKQLIAEQITKIEMDISDWRNYLNHHNEKVFSNDVFYVQVNVVGFADKQGSRNVTDRKKYNQELSENRADAVAIEFESQIKKLSERIKMKLIYLIDDSGKGEELPPGVIDGPTDDVKRRICIVSAVAGPSSIFNKRIN